MDSDKNAGAAPGPPETVVEGLTHAEAEDLLTRLGGVGPGAGRPSQGSADERAARAEARFRTLVEQIPAITFMAGLQGEENELYVSPQIEEVLGFSQKEWLENPVLWYTQLHPEDRERWQEEFARTCARGDHFRAEYRFLNRDGGVVWVLGEAKMVRDGAGRPLFLQGVAFDVTQRKLAEEAQRRSHEALEEKVRERTAELARANESLQEEIARRRAAQEKLQGALVDKEALLKEIHHRVKNNLQVVTSLLSLQSRFLADPLALAMIRESQNRIKLIALIHEMLYRSESLARIDFRRYVEELAAYLVGSYEAGSQTVALDVDVGDVRFGVDTAVPCGLVINELVTNSLKYAFPGGRRGTISIRLRPDGAARFALVVADDGVGLPAGLDFRSAPSLGLRLVHSLAGQIGGRVEHVGGPGTTFRIVFTAGGERTVG